MKSLRREIPVAKADMNSANVSVDNLSAARREDATLMARRKKEPKLSDYYTLSGDMRYYQSVVAVMVGVGCGVGAYYTL